MSLKDSLIDNENQYSKEFSIDSHDVKQENDDTNAEPLQNPVLFIVALALFCDYLLLTLCIPILPNLFNSRFDPIMISLIFASKPAVQFFANPIMGSYVDKYGPNLPLLWGVLVLALSTFLFAFGVSLSNLDYAYGVVIIARSIQGIASASTMSAGMTLCALTHHDSVRGAAMGTAMIGVALGTLIGPPIGGILGYYTYYFVPYIIVGCVLLINYMFQLMILHDNMFLKSVFPPLDRVKYIEIEKQEDFRRLSNSSFSVNGNRSNNSNSTTISTSIINNSNNNNSNIKIDTSFMSLLYNKHIALLILTSVIGNACIGLIEPLIPQYLSNQYNENILYQGVIFGCATLSYLVCTPMAGYISDEQPKWICIAMGLLCIGFGLCMVMSSGVSLGLLCFCLVCIGGGMSFVDTPILPFLSEIVQVCMYIYICILYIYECNDDVSFVIIIWNYYYCYLLYYYLLTLLLLSLLLLLHLLTYSATYCALCIEQSPIGWFTWYDICTE